jgi:hypothetical protein
MLPPVIVDLGADVGARDARVILAACNDAITNGVCLPTGSPEGERPRAIAVVRAADRRVLLVRIEVRLDPESDGEGPPGEDDAARSGATELPIIREIRFVPRDPLRERWRSVGLAIATLVGEGERRAREEEAEERAPETPAPAAPALPAPALATEPERAPPETESVQPAARSPAPASSERPADAELVRAPDARASDADPNDVDEAEPDEAAEALDSGERVDPVAAPRMPFEHRPFFVGIGVLTGPGFGGGAWRAGGHLRAGWQHVAGWQIVTSLGAAWRTSQSEFTAAWLSLDAGVGYRWLTSNALSLGAHVFGGAEGTRFEVLARAEESTEVRLNPRAGLALDGRWRLGPSIGAWVGAEVSSIGRERRLFIAPEREPIVGSAIELALSLGVGWWPE